MSLTSGPHPAIQSAHAELARALEARASGNEGKARVCARRAAGQALAIYVERHQRQHWGASAMEILARFAQEEAIPVEVRDAASRLIARITVDHVLPFPQDPLDDARLIINYVEELTRPTG